MTLGLVLGRDHSFDRTRLYELNTYLFHMLYLRKKPPADTPYINTGKPWSDFDLEDLRYFLAEGEGAERIADLLCRSVEEVRAKTAELATPEQ